MPQCPGEKHSQFPLFRVASKKANCLQLFAQFACYTEQETSKKGKKRQAARDRRQAASKIRAVQTMNSSWHQHGSAYTSYSSYTSCRLPPAKHIIPNYFAHWPPTHSFIHSFLSCCKWSENKIIYYSVERKEHCRQSASYSVCLSSVLPFCRSSIACSNVHVMYWWVYLIPMWWPSTIVYLNTSNTSNTMTVMRWMITNDVHLCSSSVDEMQLTKSHKVGK